MVHKAGRQSQVTKNVWILAASWFQQMKRLFSQLLWPFFLSKQWHFSHAKEEPRTHFSGLAARTSLDFETNLNAESLFNLSSSDDNNNKNNSNNNDEMACITLTTLSFVILSLWTIMPWPGLPGVLIWACICGIPHRHFPNLMLNLPLWFLLCLQDASQQQTSENFKKKKDLLLTGSRGCTACPGPHREVTERKRESTWCSAFIGVGMECLGFCGFTLYW